MKHYRELELGELWVLTEFPHDVWFVLEQLNPQEHTWIFSNGVKHLQVRTLLGIPFWYVERSSALRSLYRELEDPVRVS